MPEVGETKFPEYSTVKKPISPQQTATANSTSMLNLSGFMCVLVHSRKRTTQVSIPATKVGNLRRNFQVRIQSHHSLTQL